ncbi:MAG: SRPBCC domain-containing protein [Devosia sp.]|uniref:SRPBCC domain-containing protein n=1 Tax=Devosia sp. TaxID=1871048 RepID=UPI001A3C67D6|nr:SRPBCC domain-containing protein [Devosia sp.]MBL8599036.1 SRPBCC domain-containing protein [Devosia sp.]
MLTAATPAEDGRTLIITRTLKAPRELVWKMFADPYHLAQWWGPSGFTNRVERFDFRTGGKWLHVMIGQDGRELPTDNDIVEVTPPRRIVFRNAPTDPRIFGDNPPPGFTKTLTFDAVEGGTLLKLVCVFDTPEHKDAVVRRGFRDGTNESFDKLEAQLATL